MSNIRTSPVCRMISLVCFLIDVSSLSNASCAWKVLPLIKYSSKQICVPSVVSVSIGKSMFLFGSPWVLKLSSIDVMNNGSFR